MDDWEIDRSNGTATHRSGLVVEVRRGVPMNILRVPEGLASGEMARLTAEAAKVWQEAPSQLASRIGHGPQRVPSAERDSPERPAPSSLAYEARKEQQAAPATKVRFRKRRRLEGDGEA